MLEMEITHEDVTELLAAVDGDPCLSQIDLAWGGFRMRIQRDGTCSSGHSSASGSPEIRVLMS